MCKAKEYVNQLKEISESIQNDVNQLHRKLTKLEGMQQDILHMIENDSFNAAEGYFYAKKLQDIRRERREIKNEIEIMSYLKSTPKIIDGHVKQIEPNINKIDSKLTYLTEHKIYNPRVLKEA